MTDEVGCLIMRPTLKFAGCTYRGPWIKMPHIPIIKHSNCDTGTDGSLASHKLLSLGQLKIVSLN
jgi:hypothetical protein